MVKNSFTLFELILSLIILGIIFLSFSYSKEDLNKEFMLLNSLDNKFKEKNYSSFSQKTKTLTLLINSNKEEKIFVKEYLYEDKKIKLKKYEF